MNPLKKIVILGGGTSGWIAASMLAAHLKRERCEIELVDAADGGGSSVGTSNTDYKAFGGYGYFHKSTKTDLSSGLLRLNKTIIQRNDTNIRIPIFPKDTNARQFLYKCK